MSDSPTPYQAASDAVLDAINRLARDIEPDGASVTLNAQAAALTALGQTLAVLQVRV